MKGLVPFLLPCIIPEWQYYFRWRLCYRNISLMFADPRFFFFPCFFLYFYFLLISRDSFSYLFPLLLELFAQIFVSHFSCRIHIECNDERLPERVPLDLFPRDRVDNSCTCISNVLEDEAISRPDYCVIFIFIPLEKNLVSILSCCLLCFLCHQSS